MITTVYTAYSTYEIDVERKLVRRTEGQRPPTQLQGQDGEWREFEQFFVSFDGGFGFQWPGTTKATITSPVRRIVDGLGEVLFEEADGNGPGVLHL